MMVLLFLNGTPTQIDGGQWPAGVGMPRLNDQLIVGSTYYRVRSMQWFIIPSETPALRRVEIRATS